MLKKEDIRIRDPFIFTDKEHNCYYMYGTTALLSDSLHTVGSFSVYKSEDLEHFSEPKVIFDGAKCDFWADRDFWAPELHRYNGKYYLFGSVKADGVCRGTQIFVCDTPDGDFVPVSEKPVTPADWECLDGTLWVENGIPYIIFCHEWLQIKDGEICAMPLTADLSAPAGEPVVLFRASDNPDVTSLGAKHPDCYVTDGPFLFADGEKLKMIWSSFHHGKYLVLEAESDNGSVLGNWRHLPPRFDFDGGHAMLFKRLDGTQMISLHAPNKAGLERPLFLPC
ncbi:MAG: glycoside hydrolase [Ruminococcaceae bacterium]|nr:glycoside hydrolase [Oscillospiraceae bacterium]